MTSSVFVTPHTEVVPAALLYIFCCTFVHAHTEVLCMCICNFEIEPAQVWSAEQVDVHLLTVLVDYLWYEEILSETYSIYVRI